MQSTGPNLSGSVKLDLDLLNATPTIPHKLQHLKASAFQYGIADAAAVDGSRGSNVYEVNP